MIWQSAAEFWAMGGYGVYVWGSMGVSAALLALEVLLARMGRRQALDAVCEAMDAQALDGEPPGAFQASPVGPSRPLHFTQGAAS
ncbi:heme exporter protein CcmD [Limnohabitans planktonicus]|uniref:Heme exporter protein D n=1 Tax=Limnohabitans planktonicus II-D5 TaxID=1293045 RepID=A0A2T7UG52_9BURK|nr:heme exporter protein CcmD [Limnohabitans planktonicus]PVE43673.1 heme exporter protein CcmD [Limnohabitans planktonicus II-D5]